MEPSARSILVGYDDTSAAMAAVRWAAVRGMNWNNPFAPLGLLASGLKRPPVSI